MKQSFGNEDYYYCEKERCERTNAKTRYIGLSDQYITNAIELAVYGKIVIEVVLFGYGLDAGYADGNESKEYRKESRLRGNDSIVDN